MNWATAYLMIYCCSFLAMLIAMLLLLLGVYPSITLITILVVSLTGNFFSFTAYSGYLFSQWKHAITEWHQSLTARKQVLEDWRTSLEELKKSSVDAVIFYAELTVRICDNMLQGQMNETEMRMIRDETKKGLDKIKQQLQNKK